MPKFMIERNMPGAGAMSREQFREAAQKSCDILRELGPEIQWVQSYVTDDKILCEYIAPDAELIKIHAERAGFPADKIMQVKSIIDPTTAEPYEGSRQRPTVSGKPLEKH